MSGRGYGEASARGRCSGQGSSEAVGAGGSLAAPLLAQLLGGGNGTVGGNIALALFSAAGFATILAVVAGLVTASAGAIAHDRWENVLGRGSEATERKVARVAAIGVGVGTRAIGSSFNITVFAASANFPPLLLALCWRRFNTTGALTGIGSEGGHELRRTGRFRRTEQPAEVH